MRHYFQDRSTHQPKRERTRAVLLDGAIATVAERGLAGASIKAIAETAGLSNGTFYNHFEDRDQLLREAAVAVAKALTDDIAEEVTALESGVARIVWSTDAFLLGALRSPDWAAMIVDGSLYLSDVRHDLGRHFRNDVWLAVEQGELEAPPDAFVADQIGALITLALQVQLQRGRRKKVRRQTCEALLRLLGLPPEEAAAAVGEARPELT